VQTGDDGASVGITAGETTVEIAGEGDQVTVAVLTGDLVGTVDGAISGGEDEAAETVVASDIVAIGVTGNASGGGITLNIDFNAKNIPRGGGACDPPPLFSAGDSNRTCAFGCCVSGACQCQTGYGGVRCQHLFSCESSPIDATGDFSAESCSTTIEGVQGEFTEDARVSTVIRCSCNQPEGGLLAVVGHRVVPDTGVDLTLGAQAGGVGWSGVPIGVPAAFIVFYVVLAFLAARADARGVLYASAPPDWLSPRPGAGWTLCFQLLLTLRLFHSCLRWYYVLPGHTPYSRLQLVHAQLTHFPRAFEPRQPPSEPDTSPGRHISRRLEGTCCCSLVAFSSSWARRSARRSVLSLLASLAPSPARACASLAASCSDGA
jgi:hypothetical protein